MLPPNILLVAIGAGLAYIFKGKQNGSGKHANDCSGTSNRSNCKPGKRRKSTNRKSVSNTPPENPPENKDQKNVDSEPVSVDEVGSNDPTHNRSGQQNPAT